MFATLSWMMNQAPNLTQFLWLILCGIKIWNPSLHIWFYQNCLILCEATILSYLTDFLNLNLQLVLLWKISSVNIFLCNTSSSPTMISWKSLLLWDSVSMVRFAILLYKWYILCLLQIIGLAETDLQRLT